MNTQSDDQPLTIALTKGRILQDTLPLLARCGLDPVEDPGAVAGDDDVTELDDGAGGHDVTLAMRDPLGHRAWATMAAWRPSTNRG